MSNRAMLVVGSNFQFLIKGYFLELGAADEEGWSFNSSLKDTRRVR